MDLIRVMAMDKYLKTLISVIMTLVILAGIFGTGYFVGKNTNTEEIDEVIVEKQQNDVTLPGEVKRSVVTINEVKAKISEIGELSSCEGNYTATRKREQPRTIPIGDSLWDVPFTVKTVQLTCTGVVKAGYDLNEISVSVDNSLKTINIILPEVQINSNEILWDETMQCTEDNNKLNPLCIDDYRLLIPEIKAEGLKKVEEDGLFIKVENNAKNIITNFL